MNYGNLHQMVDELEHADEHHGPRAVERKVEQVRGALDAVELEVEDE